MDRKFKKDNSSYDDKTPNKFHKESKKVCAFCAEKNEVIDYKNVAKLRKYMTEKGKIIPRRTTGVCAKHQRELTLAVKRARHIVTILQHSLLSSNLLSLLICSWHLRKNSDSYGTVSAIWASDYL